MTFMTAVTIAQTVSRPRPVSCGVGCQPRRQPTSSRHARPTRSFLPFRAPHPFANLTGERDMRRVRKHQAKALSPVPTYISLKGGRRLPVGLILKANYRDRSFQAAVVHNGISIDDKTFSSLTAAAVHVKLLCGASASAASTNGWDFWMYWQQECGAWRRISLLRHHRT